MTPDDAFLQAIIENPNDEALRLIYADYLEEHGDAARAEFIRVQCRLACVPEGDPRRGSLEWCARELHQDHRKRWLTAFRNLDWIMPNIVFHRGFVGEVTVRASGGAFRPLRQGDDSESGDRRRTPGRIPLQLAPSQAC